MHIIVFLRKNLQILKLPRTKELSPWLGVRPRTERVPQTLGRHRKPDENGPSWAQGTRFEKRPSRGFRRRLMWKLRNGVQVERCSGELPCSPRFYDFTHSSWVRGGEQEHRHI